MKRNKLNEIFLEFKHNENCPPLRVPKPQSCPLEDDGV